MSRSVKVVLLGALVAAVLSIWVLLRATKTVAEPASAGSSGVAAIIGAGGLMFFAVAWLASVFRRPVVG